MTKAKPYSPLKAEVFYCFSKGDRKAFDEIYMQFNGPLYLFILKMVKSPSLTGHVVTKIWVDMWLLRAELQSGEAAETHFRQVALTRSYHYLKKIARSQAIMEKLSKGRRINLMEIRQVIQKLSLFKKNCQKSGHYGEVEQRKKD